MVTYSYDMHIHSCLSPCGDENMTPANIAGMAFIKKLSVIALTDHNSCKNCPAMEKAAEEYGLIFIPGMELSTSEDIHVLAYFPTVDRALKFDEYVYGKLVKVKNKPAIFGNQFIYNEEDKIIGEEENLLISATTIPFDEVYDTVNDFGGIAVPAHINKVANSLLGILGFMPENHKFKTIEVFENGPDIPDKLKKLNIIKDSDAHYLEHINEPINFFELEEKSKSAVLNYLNGN